MTWQKKLEHELALNQMGRELWRVVEEALEKWMDVLEKKEKEKNKP